MKVYNDGQIVDWDCKTFLYAPIVVSNDPSVLRTCIHSNQSIHKIC